jgi:superfamily II DNA or RNA helicase
MRALVELIGEGFITGELSLEDQGRKLSAWKDGGFQALFCTTCCAQCVDYPKVSLVVISFLADSIDQLQQMACRGGRNGDYCLVVLFRSSTEYGKDTKNVYEGEGCIRYRLQMELDGPELAAKCARVDTKCLHCLEEADEISRLSFPDHECYDALDNILEQGTVAIFLYSKL